MSDMPTPRPYDRRLPERHPGGRTCAGLVFGPPLVAAGLALLLRGRRTR